MPGGRKRDRLLFLGAIAALGVGVLGLTAQRVLNDDSSPPASSATAAATLPGTSSASPSARAAPALTIASPADNAAVPPGPLTLTVRVDGFRIVDKVGGSVAPGEGHLIYYRDVDFVPTQPGRPASSAPGTFFASAALTHTWEAVVPGRQAFFVQLVNNDDTPLTPPVVGSVVVDVNASASPSAAPFVAPSASVTPGP